jgi:hypothetical protein
VSAGAAEAEAAGKASSFSAAARLAIVFKLNYKINFVFVDKN